MAQTDRDPDGQGNSMTELAQWGRFSKTCTVIGDMKGAPAVHFNFRLQSFSLYITFKSLIEASHKPISLEYGRFGE